MHESVQTIHARILSGARTFVRLLLRFARDIRSSPLVRVSDDPRFRLVDPKDQQLDFKDQLDTPNKVTEGSKRSDR